jgi:hypothetical protein
MQNSIIRQQILKIIRTQPQLVEQANQMLAAVEQDEDFDLEGVDEFIAALESTLTAPESYPQVLQMLIAEDMVDAGDLPEQFDRGMIISLLAALYTLESRIESNPQGFARGGLAKAAEEIRSKGRDGDTILAHINPQEARMLRAAGGSGTINPETGLPEFRKFKSVLKKLIKVALPIALSVFAPGIGTAIGSAIGLSGTAAAVAGNALLQGTISKASGGDFLQGAIGGAIGGGLGGAAGSAANNALSLGLGSTGQQILGGAITGGLQGAATGGNVLQGALGGALGSGLGNLAGAGLNETLGLGLGDAGTRMLGSGLSGATMSGLTGGDVLSGGLAGALGGMQTDNPFASALSGAAQSKLMGGDVAQGAVTGGLAGLASKYKNVFSDTESSFLPGYKTKKPGEDQQYIPFGPPQSMQGFDPNTAGLMNMDISASPGAAAQTMRRFEPLAKGTFKVAPASQVNIFKNAGAAGTLGGQAMNLPVYDVGTGPSFVQRFIDQAQSGGYMNPQWSTYRPGVQLMASGPPSVLGVDGGATAYVPNLSYPGAADSVMLATNKQFTPQSAASVLAHELYHPKQPPGTSAYQGSRGGLQEFQQNLTNVLPHLQSKYGYSGAYDNMPLNKVPLNERMADLQSFQFNQGIDFAKDPVFQQQVLKDPYARAAYNASTIERTTRLDPRDLPPGVVTSSDFGPGGPPLMWNIQNKIKNLLPAPRRYAKGGLAEMADISRPFVGYRSAGRRPESQQDRRAAADAPLSALRGAVSGVLGAPGDIESLVRMLPGLNEQTVLPTSEDIERRLPMRELNQSPTGRALTAAGQLGGGFYMGPGSPLRAIAALPSAVSRAGRDFAMASGQPAVNVMKPKGGNWLAGSVERAIEPLKRPMNPNEVEGIEAHLRKIEPFYDLSNPREARELADMRQHVTAMKNEESMNRWLENKLGKYMRNEMATPEDPLRALAERGITHAEIQPTGYNVTQPRAVAGFPEEGMAVSPTAKAWEDRADTFINNLKASYLTAGYPEAIEKNPWLLKVPPETRVYEMLSGVGDDLGFRHLADELRNAINPESGLPANLRLKYSDLEKVTVPQAVERVAKINEWRAAQKAEADMARAMGPATQVVKEYPEQGFKWVELRQPKETGKKVSVERPEMDLPPNFDERQARDAAMDMASDEGLEEGTQAFDDFVRNLMTDFNRKKTVDIDESYKALEDALKYEGETMGHCVGGYCPDVVEGRSRIYSLRDKKGQPHVTIEVAPRLLKTWDDVTAAVGKDQASKLWKEFDEIGGNNMDNTDAAFDMFIKNKGIKPAEDIVQIKGKANRAPKEEYLPAVQDFIRSGNFGKVGDLQNTGLIDLRDPNAVLRALVKVSPERDLDKGIDNFNQAVQARPDGPQYMTLDEMRDFLGGPPPAEGFSRGGQVQGYQAGGVVKAAKKTARSLGDLVDEYVRKVRKFDELGEPTYDVQKKEAPTSADVPGWHITQDLSAILKAGAMDNRLAGTNMQGWEPAHMGGAYFYSDPRLARAQHQRLIEMVGSDPAYAAELPILRAQLRKGNRLVPDEDVSLNVPWQESYQQGSFATKRPVLLNQIDRIYSADPSVTKDMIRDTIIRRRRPGYAEGGQVSGANFPTDDFDPDRIDAIVGELHAMNAA